MYSDHEKEKKRLYNSRVIEVEHGTFTPLVFSTTGGMSRECTFFEKAERKTESEIQSEILRYNQLCKKKTTCSGVTLGMGAPLLAPPSPIWRPLSPQEAVLLKVSY